MPFNLISDDERDICEAAAREILSKLRETDLTDQSAVLAVLFEGLFKARAPLKDELDVTLYSVRDMFD